MTDGMQRLGALMRGEFPDRVPVFCNMLDQGARELRMPLRHYYSKAEYVAEGQLRLRARYGYDAVWGAHYVARDAEILGSRTTLFAEDGPPNVGDLVIKRLEDIERFEIPTDLAGHPAFSEELATIRILKEEVGGRYPVLSFVTASLSMPPVLMGIEAWLGLLLTGPASAREELLAKCSEYCQRRITALREAGADLIAYANPVATAAFMRPRQFLDVALPWVQRDVGPVGTEGLVYFNGGGRLGHTLPTLLQETSFAAFLIHPLDDIAEAKAVTSGRALLAAAINDIRLCSWSPDDVEEQTRRIMEAGAPGGSFVFSTLLMPLKIPEAQIQRMLEAAYRYGTYSG